MKRKTIFIKNIKIIKFKYNEKSIAKTKIKKWF